MALRSVIFQLAAVTAPALGGFLFAHHPVVSYATASAILLASLASSVAMNEPPVHPDASTQGFGGVLAGIRFIRVAR